MEWELDAALAASLERLGWSAEDRAMRDLIPVLRRGTNAVVEAPPAPAWGGPAIAALLSGRAHTASLLLLTAPAMIEEWIQALGAICEGTGVRVAVASASHVVSPPEPGGHQEVLLASPAAAAERHRRSALRPERFTAICFAWPEGWVADDDVAVIVPDCLEEAQRVVLTARPEQVTASDGVATRYARRAISVSAPGVTGALPERAPGRALRTMTTGWAHRARDSARVLEALGARHGTIWTADRRDHLQIRRALAATPGEIVLTARDTSVESPVVCYDPPSRAQLDALCASGEVILLVPPGTGYWTSWIAPEARPMNLSTALEETRDLDARARTEIIGALEGDAHAAALYALAPLFERYDPHRIAAAIFDLWRQQPRAPAPSAPPAESATARIWISAGRRDGATPADFVAVLARELNLDPGRIGRIEMHDTFSLVELPAAEAEEIARRLVGLTIRRRRLTARVDRGGRREHRG